MFAYTILNFFPVTEHTSVHYVQAITADYIRDCGPYLK